MNSFVFCALSVVVITLASVVGMLVVRRLVKLETLRTYHQVAGYFLALVGVLYAVLLDFVIVEAMHHMQDVRDLVSHEASGLANIFLCSEGLPPARKKVVRELCHQYAEAVIRDEWPALQQRKYSQVTFHCAFALWKAITTFDPQTSREQNIQQQLDSQICEMTQCHRSRVVSASNGVAPILWFVLIVGGVFTVSFTYFFGVSNVRVQVVMTGLLAVTLALNTYLVYAFGNPMSSELGVLPGPFQLDLLIFENFDKLSMPPAHPIHSNW